MDGFEERFEGYVEHLIEAVGHADRAQPLRGYLQGVLLRLVRKSVEPMAGGIGARAGKRGAPVADAFRGAGPME